MGTKIPIFFLVHDLLAIEIENSFPKLTMILKLDVKVK